jgi:hypothetical protein
VTTTIRAALLAIGALAVTGKARAYTIETEFTAKCHEKLTSTALRTARATLAVAPSPPVTRDDQALIDDLQFAPDPDMRDLAGATLLVGARDNDLKGNSQDDLTVLSAIHGDPTNQREHCLRGPGQKEPGGTAAALADCRAFIQERVLQALDGLDAAGRPDLARRTTLGLHLSLRGHVDAPLPTYYVRIGQAMHAIQDSFTHTYRTPDGMQVTVALNWLDEVDADLVDSRDGPAHASKLDVCDDPDALRTTRRDLATRASTALLVATLDPAKSRDEKVAAVGVLLDTYLAFSPGCTFDNGWCQAPERQYRDAKNFLGCGSAGALQDPWSVAVWCALGLLALAGGARRRRWRTAVARHLPIALALTLAAGAARAETVEIPSPPPAKQTATSTSTITPAKPATPTSAATPETVTITSTTTTSTEPNTHAAPAPIIVAVAEPGPSDPSQTAWAPPWGRRARSTRWRPRSSSARGSR